MDAHHEIYNGSIHVQERPSRAGFVISPEQPAPTSRQSQGDASPQAPHAFKAHAVPEVHLVWTARPDGVMADTDSWSAFTGESPDTLAQGGWLHAVHRDERAHAARVWAEALAATAPFSLECRVRRADGDYRGLQVRGVPLRTAEGGVREWVFTGTDLTEHVLEQIAHDTAQSQACQLKATLDTMSDGVICFDRDGKGLRMNPVARDMIRTRLRDEDDWPCTLDELGQMLSPADVHGRLFLREERPAVRVLRGETLRGDNTMDVLIRALDGRESIYNIGGAPIRDADGQLAGGVLILRDVTERQRLERQTYESMIALVAMAEALVLATPDSTQPEKSPCYWPLEPHEHEASCAQWPANPTAQRLVELARSVLGGERLGIIVVNDATGAQRPVATIRPSEDEEKLWWANVPRYRVSDYLEPDLLARLRAGEIVLTDLTQLPADAAGSPPIYGGRSALVAPLRSGERFFGYLILNYGDERHTVTDEERALVATVAKMGVLVLERERLLCEREAARSNELALREANRRMDEFLAIATHELRSPVMSSMLGVELAEQRVQRLRDRIPEQESQLAGQLDGVQGLLAQADESVGRLGRLVTDLLDVSRIRGGQLVIRPQPTDLAVIVRDVVAKQRQLTPKRAISLHLLAAAPVPVVVDADRIGQVVTNYLANALKYSPEDRPVDVHVLVHERQARVSVRDQGPGLPDEEQRRIWEQYHQVPGIKANPGTGTGLGLGLFIGQTLIERHGGQVGVESAQGKGSTFWFTLPLGGPGKCES